MKFCEIYEKFKKGGKGRRGKEKIEIEKEIKKRSFISWPLTS